ncbi:MAG: hypothetical protein Kow002_16580 [Anaerolineales bacterium]
MAMINVLLGAALLFFGRKMFWLFIAGAGFMAGMDFAVRTFNGPEWLSVAVGVAVGLIAALLAVFVQQFAIGLAGFLGGGYLAMQLLPFFNFEIAWVPWAVFLVGGILGAVLVNAFLDWTLIILSSVAGASLLTGILNLNEMGGALLLIVLAAIGISYQARVLRKEKKQYNSRDATS